MEKSKISCYLLFSIVVVMMELAVLAEDFLRFSYIVHVDKALKPGVFDHHVDWYNSMVEDAYVGSRSDPLPLLYTYNIAMHGFVAKLTSTEAESLNKMYGILGVFQDSMNKLYTTRTPEFLGLSSRHGLWSQTGYGHDIIVGILDSGVWPESKSFSDQGLKKVPARWKGKCQEGDSFNSSNCNKKLIGASFFLKGYEANMGPISSQDDYRSPRDSNGHGSHTSSTAVGSAVPGSSLLGFANGTARGMAPKARLAVYKVCWPQGCASSDILAGMEAALSDGVDVLSLSIGGTDAPYYSDPIAIGAFEAAERGVFVSCSAGNSGPTPSDISNTAPWITTVGASTIDRIFPAPVTLGNGAVLPGSSIYKATNASSKRRFPVVYAQTASANDTDANLCLPGSLDPNMVRRKIVVCDRGENGRKEKGLVVRQAGGVGMILTNGISDGNEVISDCHILPATAVGYNAGIRIKAYINKTGAPTATIKLQGITVVRKVRAPVVAGFSSRGPNPMAAEILKPDLIAPGVDILAAWTKRNSPSELSSDKRRVAYNIVSGTSMSCPHVAGIGAIIRAAHRNWSSAAIKSALMTSSRSLDNTNNSIRDSVAKAAATPFALGAGHVNPPAAINPGLVYDLGIQDYVNFLCSLNYTKAQILILTKKQTSCSRSAFTPGDLNYPSFSVVFKPGNLVQNTKRTVTNVGEGPSVYELDVGSPANVKITVEPKNLVFKSANEKASYSVRFETQIPASPKTDGRAEFGYLSWKCIKGEDHVVRSPVAVSWSAPEF